MAVLSSLGQDASSYDPPGHLAFDQTYYWRVDEVEHAPDFTVHKGAVWSFTVEPFAREIGNRGRQAFEEDELIQSWVLHQLQIIGEALRNISEDFRRDHTEIPWKETIGMRNILIHRYFELDANLVWTVVIRDLPDLKEKVGSALKEFK